MLRIMQLGSAAAIALAVAACGSSGSSGSGGTTVHLTAVDFAFQPTQLTVPAGATVTVDFTNNGKTEHSFTLDNGGTSVDADGGGSATATFTAPQSGTLSFHCKYHPTQMKGTITVGSGGGGAGSSSSSSSSSGY
jgi:plastocyanin